MPNSDILFTNVELVPPDNTAANAPTILGVSIVVQPDTIPAGTGPWVGRPWTWTGISPKPAVTWTVLGRTAPGAAWETIPNPNNPNATVIVRNLPSDPNEATWNPVIDDLKNSMNELAATLPPGPNAAVPLQQISIDNNSFSGDPQQDIPASQKWASLLLNLTSAPYPIPEKLQLTSFLELTNSIQYQQFLALPSFTAGQDYDPSGQLPPAANPPDFWEIANVNGIKMHSEFSQPNIGKLNLIQDSLWLPPAHSADSTPLVANWQAHLYELLGPYVDTAHLLTSAVYDPAFPQDLGAALGSIQTDWKPFRDCVVQGIYVLVSGDIALAHYNAATWIVTLRKQLASLNPMPNALADNPGAYDTFAQEMTELRQIVAAASTGATLAALVGTQPNSVPPNYLKLENAPALLALLQTRLATAYTKDIVNAANATPATVSPTLVDIMTAVLQSLLKNVLRPNLLTQLNTVFPNASAVPAAIETVCYPVFDPAVAPPPASPTIDFRRDLFTLALGTAQPGTAPALTANAPPLVLPAVAARAAGTTAIDPLRGFRGVSVLLRRTEKDQTKWTKWTCPGIAAPVTRHTDQATHTISDVPQTDLPLLVATRLVYDRDLLTGSMLYNNGPLACANLLHEYLDQDDRLHHPKPGDPNFVPGNPDPSATPASVLQYVSYEGGGGLTAGTPGLRAGWSYDFVTFAISNSGALPAELRDGYPSRFKLIDTLPGTVRPSSVRYFRTVPVAGLETCDAQGNHLQTTSAPYPVPLFPVVPDNVWPQATDTKTPAGGQGINGAVQPPDPQPHLPLLLLTPPDPKRKPADRTTSNVTFSVRLPSVDPQTWLTTDGYNKKDTADLILNGAYLQLQRQQCALITDPLITSVDFTLYRWENGAWSIVSIPVSYMKAEVLNQNPDPKTLPGVETLPIVISVDTRLKANNLGFSALNFDGSSLLPRVAQKLDNTLFTFDPGSVYLLEARLTLNLTTPDGVSMMPGYAPGSATPLPNAPPPPPGAPAPPPCIAGYQLLIEVGSTAMPTDLMTPLSLNLLPIGGLPDQQVRFSMAANGNNWQNVHRVDFLRQMWKWTGRTQPSVSSTDKPGDLIAPQFFPAPPAQLDDPVTAAWELIEFAERPPVDHIESLSAFNPATTSYDFTLDLSLDPRATFLRVAPRIFSRYQGLWNDTSWSVVSSIDIPANVAWARAFVRSRAKTLKMPRLKALLPLTESAFTPGTPGILAVFDGPAYEQAGLAERLNVSFSTMADPDLSGKVWIQAGPDFLAGAVQPLATPDQQLVPGLLAIGPIGHTADPLSGLDHKFLSHSYIIRPDPAKPNAGRDFSWWFASLNFQLRTDVASSVLGQPILSETAFGSWIQFLPGFQDHNRHEADRFDDWTFTVTSAPGQPVVFTLLDHKGNPQTPGETTSHLTPFLMVNRIVLDIVGKPREDYLGIAVYSNAGYSLLGNDWTPGTNAHVRVIQTRQGLATKFNDHVEFWQSVVGNGNETLASNPKRTFPNDRERTVPVNLSAPIKAASAS